MPRKESSNKKQRTQKRKGAGRKQLVHDRPTAKKTSATSPSRKPSTEIVESLPTVIRQFFKKINCSTKPLPPGTVGEEVPIDSGSLQKLFAAVATEDNSGSQIWVKDNLELLVFTGQVKVELDDGFVLVTIPVSCEQTESTVVQVPFAVGSQDQPAGMVCATEERPRGPALIVDVWGEALTAFAWRVFLTLTNRVSAQS